MSLRTSELAFFRIATCPPVPSIPNVREFLVGFRVPRSPRVFFPDVSASPQ